MILTLLKIEDRVVVGVGGEYELVLIAGPKQHILAAGAGEGDRALFVQVEDQIDRIGRAVTVGHRDRQLIRRSRALARLRIDQPLEC